MAAGSAAMKFPDGSLEVSSDCARGARWMDEPIAGSFHMPEITKSLVRVFRHAERLNPIHLEAQTKRAA